MPDVLTREQMDELDNENLLNHQNETERHTVNQRFSELNRHYSELSNLVLALTEKIPSNNGEAIDLNSVSYAHETRSDMCCPMGRGFCFPLLSITSDMSQSVAAKGHRTTVPMVFRNKTETVKLILQG